MDRLKLVGLQVLVAVVSVALWHVLTTISVGDKPLLPPFFFSTPFHVAARVYKWYSEGTNWRHRSITLWE
jgi:NitT/TauT family transport system permease protein